MRNRTLLILAITLAVMPLCACSDETTGRMLAAPHKYTLYNCQELALEAQGVADRQHELEGLMKKAEVDVGGRLASSMAYRPDYLLLRGQMDQIRRTAAEKGCNLSAGANSQQGEKTRQ